MPTSALNFPRVRADAREAMRFPHDTDFEDDPVVRSTVLRLRASLVAVTCGSVAFTLLGLLAVHAPDGPLPPLGRLLPLMAGFAALGATLVVVVRAPFARAREQAIELVDANRRLSQATLEAFAALGAAVEAKDRYTAGHGLRVTLVSILIGQELDLSEPELDTLRHAATFHDIGKIAVPDAVLQRRGRLSDSDFEAMKVHPVEGARICSKLHVLADAVPLVRSHHERVDGRGYPDALKGDEIPLGARIIAVADAWDAITSDRPYREGQPAFVALEEIRRCSGSQFDERVVRAFVEVLARDPWMFGLSPEDVAARRPLPAPTPASRGVDERDDPLAEPDDEGALVRRLRRDIDWSEGLDGGSGRRAS